MDAREAEDAGGEVTVPAEGASEVPSLRERLARAKAFWADRATWWTRRRELWAARPRVAPWAFGGAGVLLIYFSLGFLYAYTMGLYGSGDETRHVAYAVQLHDGITPKVTDRVPSKKVFTKDSGNMAAAAHPPLYYRYVGGVLKNAPNREAMLKNVRKARMMTVALGAVALVYVLRIGLLLFPRHKAIALATMALLGTLPQFIDINAIVSNDAFGFMMMAGVFHGSLRLLVLGVTPWRFMVAGMWITLAPQAKFTTVGVIGPALLMMFIAIIWWGRGGWLRRVAIAAALSTLVLASMLVVSGPFYLNNHRLYGDMTAAKAFLPLFKRKPNGTTLSLMMKSSLWTTFFGHLWGRLSGGIKLGGAVTSIPLLLVLPTLAGLVKVAVSVRKRARSILVDRRTTGVFIGLLAFALVMIAMFAYHAKGGSMNARYAFGAIWVPLMFLAIGMACSRTSVFMEWSVGAFVVFSVAIVEVFAQAKSGAAKDDFALARAMRKASLPGATTLVLAFAAIAVGSFLLLLAIRRLYRPIGIDDLAQGTSER